MNTMQPHWAVEYIGKPWRMASDGPDAFDCWGLVVEIQRRLYGRNLETIQVDPKNLRLLIETIRDHPVRLDWRPTASPKEGDVALLRQSRHPVHVGVWLEVDGGGILHAMRERGVVFQNMRSLHLNGWQIENFYEYTGGQHDGDSRHSAQPVPAGAEQGSLSGGQPAEHSGVAEPAGD